MGPKAKAETEKQLPELVANDFSANEGTAVPESLTMVGRVVHWKETPSFSRVSVLLEARQNPKPGQLLAVWHGRREANRLTVLQVENCFEVNPSEEPTLAVARERLGLNKGYAHEELSTRIYRLAACQTIEDYLVEELKGKGWKIISSLAPETLSRAGDPVILLPQEIAIDAVGGLADASAGVNLGVAYGPSAFPVTLKTQMFQMHTGIFGNPGKGKSYLGGVMVEEAYSWGIPLLLIDVNGEMAEAAESLGGLVITLPDPKKFGLSLEHITPPELVSIAPNVQSGTVYAELIELAHARLRGEKRGKRISFDDLRARIVELGAEVQGKASTNIAISRISALERDPLIGDNFDFISNLIKHRLIVLDCRFLSLGQTQLIAAMAARQLQVYGREMARKAFEEKDAKAAKWFALLFIDEAHAVVPNNEETVSTQVIYELARMGRHVRTGMILSSQSPSDLDRSVLKRLQTRFIFALEKDQLASIGGVTADLGEELMAHLPKLPRGVCAVSGTSELIKHGFLLQVKKRITPVGGGTPSVFEGRKKTKVGK
jgi:DNA helicase HerA-like ATPase